MPTIALLFEHTSVIRRSDVKIWDTCRRREPSRLNHAVPACIGDLWFAAVFAPCVSLGNAVCRDFRGGGLQVVCWTLFLLFSVSAIPDVHTTYGP